MEHGGHSSGAGARAPFGSRSWPLLALVAYSLMLLGAEVLGSVELARSLCTDIVGPNRFYAVNTTLSVFLLGAAAVVLWFAAGAAPAPPGPAAVDRRFCFWQGWLLLYLAADDRFLLHETLGERLGVNDALVLLVVGVGELVLLGRLARLGQRRAAARRWLAGAALAFTVMLVVDGFFNAATWFPRLSVEDLAKTWGSACLFGFAWHVARDTVRIAIPETRRLAA